MKNTLARNIVRTFSTQFGCQLIAIVSGIFIARMIGPAGKGFLSYAAIGISFVSVFFYGFSDAVMYQIGKLKYSSVAVYTVAVRIFLAIVGSVVAILLIIAAIVPSQRPLAAAAVALPFAMYIQVTTPFLMLRDNMTFVNVRAIVQSLGTALVTIALLLFHFGLAAAAGVWVLFFVVAALQSAWAMRPILAPSAEAAPAPRDLMAEQVRFGFRAAGGSLAGFLNMRISILLVSIMFAPAALGWYTLAIGSGELLWQVSRAFVWSALGRIGSDSLPQAAELVARLTRNTLAIVGSLGIIAFVTGPWLIVHVYGSNFAPAGAALRWALPGMVAYAAEVALTKFIVLQLGRPLLTVWVQLTAAMMCALLTFVTASHFGIVAAAASTSFTYLLVTTVLVGMFLRGTTIPLERLLFIQREDVPHYADMIQSMLRTLRLRSA